MAGKRTEAGRISEWLGSLGKVGAPPSWFFEIEAAKILGCSYLELRDHPDKSELMSRAFTFERGTADGEYLKEMNREYQRQRKAAQKEIEAARK